MIKTITAAELINGRTFDRTIIDIRPAEEYKKGSMDAALNIPEDKLVEYLENPEEADMESGTIGEGKAWEEGVNVGKLLAAIPKDKPVWVLCHTGNKSLYVAELLDDAGFDAGSVEGGYRSFLRLSLSMMVMNGRRSRSARRRSSAASSQNTANRSGDGLQRESMTTS